MCEALGVTGSPLICLCGLLLFDNRGTEHSLANSVQRSYAMEWEARIGRPGVPAVLPEKFLLGPAPN